MCLFGKRGAMGPCLLCKCQRRSKQRENETKSKSGGAPRQPGKRKHIKLWRPQEMGRSGRKHLVVRQGQVLDFLFLFLSWTPHHTSPLHPTNLPWQTSQPWIHRGWRFLYSSRWRRWRTFPSHSCPGLWVRDVLLASVLYLKDTETPTPAVSGLSHAVSPVLSQSNVMS